MKKREYGSSKSGQSHMESNKVKNQKIHLQLTFGQSI